MAVSSWDGRMLHVEFDWCCTSWVNAVKAFVLVTSSLVSWGQSHVFHLLRLHSWRYMKLLASGPFHCPFLLPLKVMEKLNQKRAELQKAGFFCRFWMILWQQKLNTHTGPKTQNGGIVQGADFFQLASAACLYRGRSVFGDIPSSRGSYQYPRRWNIGHDLRIGFN